MYAILIIYLALRKDIIVFNSLCIDDMKVHNDTQ